MPPLVNTTPIIVAFAALVGLVFHEAHVDRATAMALSRSSVLAHRNADKIITYNYHTHIDRVSGPKPSTALRSSLPNSHPPRDNERKIDQNRKTLESGGGNQGRIWPNE